MRVLVVEDDPAVREGIVAVLREHRYDVSVAEDGAAALDLALQSTPDVVLLDLAMPHLGGDELLETMRATPGLERVPVVIMSAWARNIAPPVEVAGWLPKPFEPQELLAVLRKATAGGLGAPGAAG